VHRAREGLGWVSEFQSDLVLDGRGLVVDPSELREKEVGYPIHGRLFYRSEGSILVQILYRGGFESPQSEASL
jgi:hypothetical protein